MKNCHMIVGSSAHESQEKDTITFCSQQGLDSCIFRPVGEEHVTGRILEK